MIFIVKYSGLNKVSSLTKLNQKEIDSQYKFDSAGRRFNKIS